MRVLVIQNDTTSSVSFLGDHLEASGVELTKVLPHHGGSLPADTGGFDGVILLGGAQSVRNEEVFDAYLPTVDLIRDFHRKSKPILGLCLGSQLMARAFDAKVRLNDVFEYGYLPLDVTEDGKNDPLLKGLSPRQHIMQWHEDTFALPAGAVLLMTGATTANQVFRYGDTAYGFQCHFEVSTESANHWIENFNHVIHAKLGKEEGDKAIDRARQELKQHGKNAVDFCRIVGTRWAKMVEARKLGKVA